MASGHAPKTLQNPTTLNSYFQPRFAEFTRRRIVEGDRGANGAAKGGRRARRGALAACDAMTDAVDACVNGTAANATSVDCVKLQDPYLAVVGVMCAVISCIGSTIALLIIKVSTEKEKHLKLWHRKRFWFGLFVNVTCEVSLTPIALALAPLAIVSPIASLGIVWTAWFSARGWIIPKESVSLQDYFGMALCIEPG